MDDPGADKFFRALKSEDELGGVLRAHMLVESVLNDLLEQLVPFPEELIYVQLTYTQKIDLVIAMGLTPDMRGPLKALGKLRNEFAHKMDMQLDANRVQNFYKSFSCGDKQLIHIANDATRKHLGVGAKGKMKNFSPKDKFIMYATSLRTAILVAVEETKETPSR